MSAHELTKEMMERYERLGCHYPTPAKVSRYDREAYLRHREKCLAAGLTVAGHKRQRVSKLTT